MADLDDDEGPEIVASSLDELTHAELRAVYDDSVNSILFAKGQQWRTVGSTLLLFLVLVGLVRYVSHAESFIALIKIVIIVSGTGALMILGVYQFWQHTESRRIDGVTLHYSNVFKHIRGIKSDTEANIHRYLLLAIMVVLVVLSGYVALEAISLLQSPAIPS